MSDDAKIQRGGDRRTGQGGYDGPERRVADRRMPDKPPVSAVDPAALSDLDLSRAYQRSGGRPGNPDAEALRAEIERRNLDV